MAFKMFNALRTVDRMKKYDYMKKADFYKRARKLATEYNKANRQEKAIVRKLMEQHFNTNKYRNYKKYFRINMIRYPEYVSSKIYSKYKTGVQTYKSTKIIYVNGLPRLKGVPMVKATDRKNPKGYTYYYTVREVYKLNSTSKIWVKTQPIIKLKNSEVKKLKSYKKIKLANTSIKYPGY